MSEQQRNFDFNAFNELVQRKPARLQLYLAQQLLSEAMWSMERYDNPRQNEVRVIFDNIKSLRIKMKEDAESRN